MPAYEIDQVVEKGIRDQLASLLHLDSKIDGRLMNDICAILTRDSLMQAVKKIRVSENSLEIDIKTALLQKEIEEALKTLLPERAADTVSIVVPFRLRRARNRALLIGPAPKPGEEKDPFDLPARELKNVIRGIIWRNEYFSGMTVPQIAQREGCGVTLVGKLIHQSLEIA